MACRALFTAMLVSRVPTCTECIGWGIGISADGIVVTKCLVSATLVGTVGSKVLHYLFVLEEDHDLVAF
jgi:putative Mn2+ efflux pump MntP